jgi:DNA polymerase zeta
MTILGAKTGKWEQRMLNTQKVCVSCTGIASSEPVECESLDCPWLYARKRAEHKLDVIEMMDILVDELNSNLSRSPTASPDNVSDSYAKM